MSFHQNRFSNFRHGGANQTINTTRSNYIVDTLGTAQFDKGLSKWWDKAASRIRPEASLQPFRFRLSFVAQLTTPVPDLPIIGKVSIPADYFVLPSVIAELDVSETDDGSLIIQTKTQTLYANAGQHAVDLNFDLFSSPTFFKNGGRVTLRTTSREMTISNKSILIKEG